MMRLAGLGQQCDLLSAMIQANLGRRNWGSGRAAVDTLTGVFSRAGRRRPRSLCELPRVHDRPVVHPDHAQGLPHGPRDAGRARGTGRRLHDGPVESALTCPCYLPLDAIGVDRPPVTL